MLRYVPSAVAAALAAVSVTLFAPPLKARADKVPGVSGSAADRWGRAFNSGDLDAVVALYTRDAELLPKGTDVVRGRSEIRRYFERMKAERKGHRITFRNVESFGEGSAISELADVEVRNAAGTLVSKSRQILVLLQVGGEWKIHRDMWTRNETLR